MLKIPKTVSATISLIFAFLAGAAVLALGATLRRWLLVPGKTGYYLPENWWIGYFGLAIALAAIVVLIVLLVRVRRGLVFTAASVSCLRGISWLCVLEAIFFAVFAFVGRGAGVSPYALLLAGAAMFMCLIVRVVKNVIEEATAIKAENDFTI